MPTSTSFSQGQALDIDLLLSKRIRRWQPGAIRRLIPLGSKPGMISLVPGMPHPSTFPFSNVSFDVKNPDGGPEETITLGHELTSNAFQYDLAGGNAHLIDWFLELQKRVHGFSKGENWSCCVGNGSQDLIFKAFQVFTDPGDAVMIESGVVGFLKAENHKLIEIPTDAYGIIPAELEKILSSWLPGRPRPKVLYTTPIGSNPTGATCPESRKIEILMLAYRFDFVIFEDDAYYYLNYDPPSMARSYLGLEVELMGTSGRVARFDSLSKVVSSGMRIGFLTGSKQVVQLVTRVTENTNLQPCTTTQVLALALFRHWGHDGFLTHGKAVADLYRRRRDLFCAAASKHLAALATWHTPTAGMFLWLKLRLPRCLDSFELMEQGALQNRVLALPGGAFFVDSAKTSHIRISFSLIAEDQIDEACARLADLVRWAWETTGEDEGASDSSS
ncbi:uncharacterized protein PpBr36_09659 [Pyricularia pennisetigena]|uniref:uncharacterized protein n=1 Tax=Pyricularia pennisetigena TaxID=1578925 RepID=UPI001153C8EA|nr:uncharacterized protein PpBr36_09659 [Pyricularia pennisetigena]TLS21968.1 hypothetical protein PpBr36_09659 [Pyricularia pennisetigena]